MLADHPSAPPPAARALRIPLPTRVVVAIGVVCLLMFGLDLWRSRQAMLVELAQSATVHRNLARVLAEQMRNSIHSVEVVLTGLRGRIETEGLVGDPSAALHSAVSMRARELPIIREIYAEDAAGRRILGGVGLEPEGDVAGGLLVAHRDSASRAARVGPAIQDPRDGKWLITVSERLATADGQFVGIIVATVALADLQTRFDPIDVGPLGVISLNAANGAILVRKAAPGAPSADTSGRPVMGRALWSDNGTTFAYTSQVDGIQRLGSAAQIPEYGLTVVVSPARDDILAHWWADAQFHMLVCLVIAAGLCLLGGWLVAQVAARTRAEQHYRLLAENSNDGIVSFALDGSLLYASPAFASLIGRTVDECADMNMDEIVYSPDRAKFMLVDGEVREGSACFRYVCRDGVPRWVEGSTRLAAASPGLPAHYVASIRDISERKLAERRIEDLNIELAAQASTDGLTGVANRRRFDEALTREWRRAARESTPVSLLLLDVDLFKRFNDRYGHLQGDECLRAVAGALAGSARRSADLLARYGGEEFVILLPNTDQAGAALLAEDARAAVEAAAVEHADSTFGQVVTCSVGFATLYPQPDDLAGMQQQLIGVADAALYEAKRAGRNRVAPPRQDGRATPEESGQVVSVADPAVS